MSKRIFVFSIIFIFFFPYLLSAQYIQWVKRYNGPVHSYYNSDEPTAIAVDNQGNVYVTGSSVGRVAYQWRYYDWATIKYYSNGETAWVRRYDEPINHDDFAYALAVDESGNVYVTGSSYTSDSTYRDWLTIKYNPTGDIVWSKRFNGTENQYDEATAIAIDNQGYIYVTGYSFNSTGWTDYTTIKYNSNGDTVWIRHYNNNAFNSEDEACAIAVDNQGNVFVTGKSYGFGYWYDIATIKYNSSGVQQWVSRYTYSGNNHDEPRAIAVDNQGNVYVTGQSMDPGYYGGGNCVTIKYLSNGDTAWVRRYNGTANEWDEGKDIAVNNQGDVYITGVTSVPGQFGFQTNYLTIKYNSLGSQQWLQRYNLPDTSDCNNIASSIVLDTSGNIYVTGLSYDNNRENDFATIKYNPSGNQQWVARYNGPGNSYDDATAITVDLAGNVYVTGKSYANDYDYATIKYYQTGPNDVGVDSIIYPPVQHLRLMPIKPCALVRNFGTSPQTNFPVVCSIIEQSGIVRYVNTKIVSYLASYETTRVYFDDWTPTVSETCVVKMRTNLIGDQNPNNDQKICITTIEDYLLLLSEGFENTTFPPTGWQRVIVQGSYNWIRRTFNVNPICEPYEGDGMASYQSYNAPYGSKARLISPPINLGPHPKTCRLNFAMYHDPGRADKPDSIKIEYSIDRINFRQVAAFHRYQPYSGHWEEYSVELGVFSGTIYLGILAFSGYGNNMNIDLVQVYGCLPLFNDIGVDEITSPLPIQQVGLPIIPSARIKNYGINNQSNFPVVCSIISSNGVLRYTNTQNAPSLLFADTARVNFAEWTPNIEEICTVKIRTLLTNDENSLNDRNTKQTEITSAQILLSEGFNDETFPPLGWQSTIVNGYYNWERKTSNVGPPCLPYEGLAMASYRSYDAYEGSMARLISPPIPVGTTPVACSLKFFMYHDSDYIYYPDSVKIEYSFDGANFTTIASFARYAPTVGWVEHSVFLNTLSDTIYVGLLAYSGYGNNMNIDYVRLIRISEYLNDVGIDAIIQPTSNQTLNIPITPIARVKNYGTSTQTNFSVSCSIFGISSALLTKLQDVEKSLTSDFLSQLSNSDYVVRYTDTARITSLAAGETTQVNFRSWTPTVIEPCIIRIRTNLTSDQNPYNNIKDRLTSISQSQYLLVQGFNDTIFPPPGWQRIIVNGTYNWERKTSNEDPPCLPYEGAAMASYKSYSASAGSMARLISPPIVLGATPSPCSLTFFMYHDPGYSNYPDSVKIEYSTNGTNFTRVAAFRRYAQAAGWVKHQLYLGSFSGTIYLGILAFSGYGNNMNIDYVQLFRTEPLVNDVGLEKIIAPGNFHTPNTPITPIALIRNFGAITQTNFQTICSIISPTGTTITSSVTVPSLGPDDTTSVVFPSWIPATTGICTIKIRTNLTNDQYPTNDRKQVITQIGTNFTMLTEGFNNITFPPSGWQSLVISGSYNWIRKTSNEDPPCLPYEGSAMASYPSYDAGVGEMARLISPPFHLGSVPIACSLRFFMYHDTDYSNRYDYIRIEYSTDGINFNTVDSFLRYQPGTPAWAEHSVAIGSFTGMFYLGILARSDFGNNINIDYVRLTGRAIANDVGLDAIIYPSSQHLVNTPLIPIARIKNYGYITQNNFQVICSIVGTGNEKTLSNLKDDFKVAAENLSLTDFIRYVDTLRVTSLGPNETTRVSFRSWIPITPEFCTVKVRTKLTNDQNLSNDRKIVVTQMLPATAIITPNGGEIWAGATTKRIRWTAPQTYARYVLILSTNSGATYLDTIVSNLSPTDTAYDWQVPMLNLRTCRIKVAIFDNTGALVAQDASDADFTIDSYAPSIPILISPLNNAYLRDSLPIFYWHKSTDVDENENHLKIATDYKMDKNFTFANFKQLTTESGIANYQLQYATNSNFTGATQINLSDTFYQVPVRLIDTTYYWRVRAIDSASNQSNWTPIWSFEIDTRIPNAPALISPINGIWLTNTNVIFNWSQVTLAKQIPQSSLLATDDLFDSPVRYILQVDTNRNFTNPVTDTTNYLSDTLSLTQAKYYWRVRAYDLAGNQGSFSSPDSFGVDFTAPSVPVLISPANGAILTDSLVTFIWRRSTDNLSGVANYEIQYATNPAFVNPSGAIRADTFLTVFLIDTTYWWRVKAIDYTNNQSNWSPTRNFTITTTAITETQDINNLLLKTKLNYVHPNPIRNNTTRISFILAQPSDVILTIYNASGDLVKLLLNKHKQVGEYNINWNCRNYLNQPVSNGIYFYTLQTDHYHETRKLVIIR